MRRALLAAVLLSCALATAARAQAVDSLAADVTLRELADGVWLHTTLSDSASGSYPANGLIVRAGSQSVLIDTGWNDRQAGLLMQWADRVLAAPVRLAIATHSHYDRTGGLAVVEANDVRILLLDSTAVRLPASALTGQIETFHDQRLLELTGSDIEVFHPGPGHTPDNIVVWLPAKKILFGGCFVKDAHAKDLGNIADADLARWPASMQRVIGRYGGAAIVVPGHGDPGGRELLAYTTKLLKKKR